MGVNCLRTFPLYQSIVWGSRTLAGSDIASSPFKYVPVRRLADFIEQSLQQSLRWAVFEPNAPTLWASVTLEVTAFMAGLFAAGAFAGSSAAQAYTVAVQRQHHVAHGHVERDRQRERRVRARRPRGVRDAQHPDQRGLRRELGDRSCRHYQQR